MPVQPPGENVTVRGILVGIFRSAGIRRLRCPYRKRFRSCAESCTRPSSSDTEAHDQKAVASWSAHLKAIFGDYRILALKAADCKITI